VVYLPLWKNKSDWIIIPTIGENKIHVPNHRPDTYFSHIYFQHSNFTHFCKTFPNIPSAQLGADHCHSSHRDEGVLAESGRYFVHPGGLDISRISWNVLEILSYMLTIVVSSHFEMCCSDFSKIRREVCWKKDGKKNALFIVVYPRCIPTIWVNYYISLTWILRPFGDHFPYYDSSEGEQWGRYNLPR